MRIHPLLPALLLACACAPAAHAQAAVLRPGAAEVSGGAIPERTEEFGIYAGEGDGDGVRVGGMTLRTRLVTSDGVPVIVRTELTWMHDELAQVDTFVLDRRTLAPLRMHSAGESRHHSLRFSPGGVRSVFDADWGADTTEIAIPEPVFLSGTTDMLLGALPLADGYTARLAVYDREEGLGTIRVEVEAADEITLPDGGGRVRTWRVGVREGGMRSTYWMDRESHTMVRFEPADGAFRIVRSRAGRSRARPTD